MSGSLLLLAVQSVFFSGVSEKLYQLTSILLCGGAIAKIVFFYWIGKPGGSTIKTATGFTQASVRLLDQGHTSNSFLNNEFGYTVTANRLIFLRLFMLVIVFVLPFLLLLLTSTIAIITAAVLAIVGLLIERWLFFAEARHVVRLYHGEQTA
jgi:hypothetical protein